MLVIGLNQTIDRTIRLDQLMPGQVLRAQDATVAAGGKAVNVCRMAKVLGQPCRLIGPFPGKLGRLALELLAEEGIAVDPVMSDGELRGATIVMEFDETAVGPTRTTVLNEPGPPLAAGDWELLVRRVTDRLGPTTTVALSGSAPPGAPDDSHLALVELVQSRGGFVAVDCTGSRLEQSVTANADLVSPNLAEAEQLLGWTDAEAGEEVDRGGAAKAEAATRAKAAAAGLVEAGARAALVSAGRFGAALASAESCRWIAAPEVSVANPIGAGDSLLSATLVAVENGEDLATAATKGVAAASAAVAHPIAGYADPELLSILMTETSVPGCSNEGRNRDD